MKNLKRDSIDFGRGQITPMFLDILVPTFLGLLSSSLFVFADGIFVGQGVGGNALGAVNILTPLYTLGSGLSLMIASGSSVIASVHLSRGNEKTARIIITQAFSLVCFLGLALGILLYSMPERVLRLLGANDALMPMSMDYMMWCIPAIMLEMVQMVGQFTARLDGSPRFAMMIQMVPAVANVFLDWLFIFPLGLGLKGAALATSIGGTTGVLMTAVYMLHNCRTLRFYRLKATLTSLLLTLRNIWYMVKIGFSSFIGQLSVSVLVLCANYRFMALLGEDGVTAYGVCCYILPVVMMVFYAICQSAQPIISFNYGAGNEARVRKTYRLSILFSVSAGLLLMLLTAFFAEPMVSVFIPDGSRAHDLCVQGFPYYAISFLFVSYNQAECGYLQSIESATKATVLTVLRGMLLPVAAFFIAPALMGTVGLWLAVPFAEAATCAVILLAKVYKNFFAKFANAQRPADGRK